MSLCYFKGALVISRLLMDNCILKELWMGDNNIGEDGITIISTALANSRISTLGVGRCGITLTGVRSLATVISVCQSIRILWLHSNPITTEGAHLILQSAVNNKACLI